jgi:two-component system sensor histidine kinase UhpB
MTAQALAARSGVAAASARARFLLLMDHSLELVELVGSDGVIMGVSSAISALAGYDPAELVGQSYKDIIHPDDCASAAAAFASVLASGRAGPITLRYRRKDGTWRTVEVTARNSLEDPAANAIIVLTRDVTEQLQAEVSLATANSELHRLSQQLLVTQDAERAHLARELHDDLGQVLVGLRLSMESRLRSAGASVPDTAVQDWIRLLSEAQEHVRDLTRSFRPPALDEHGLGAALRAHVDRVRDASGQDIRIALGEDLGGVPRPIEVTCFRIVQEALTNALKHSGARHFQVRVHRVAQSLHVTVTDDGHGFDVATTAATALGSGCVGLLSMRERAALVGGSFDIQSSAAHGTQIHASLPCSPSTS